MTARIGWAALMLLVASPALADVKAGVDAWSRGDYTAAVAQWRGPAIAGDADAQFNLGQAYKLGRGVPVDLAQAEQWYAKAAASGHPMASDNYGLILYQQGKRGAALPWLEKSAARDERRAELILGTMLFNGDNVPKDEVRAYALISRSSQQGLSQGSTTLAQMDGFLTPEQRQQGSALATRIADGARAAQAASGTGVRRPQTVSMEQAVDGPVPNAVAATPSATPPRRGERPLPSRTLVSTPPAVQLHPSAPSTPRAPVVASVPPHPTPSARGGHWRVQLGAFRAPGAAQALWSRVGSRVGGQPGYLKAGAVTRLQAGPFASKADAERACHASGVSCVVVPG